ncbi:Uncharacterised protein [Zhongshania aliphaticivorans]|uniref:Uncharacterized protein n=1 Tax=Zhongshania aliphaticivorans TaxID=1470434 RepID=A0A5S9MU53_9GAMM|nr:hypothetical protein [Zhongshania aliphaticivorans]CAA0079583.1 Uncharacterised protein [Zhongshania aliphaticivorans]CAA0086071.1 Uncharacterised protein [Zhongshania aliphaticivorans]
MTRLSPFHRTSLLAVLLLCLSWSAWLQGNHIHIAEHAAIDACVLCHYNTAAMPSSPSAPDIITVAQTVIAVIAFLGALPLSFLSPPARAPPRKFIVV